MDHFAGMDVSVKETSVCILDDAGKIVKEVKVASEPQALLKVLGNPAYRFKRIGLEAGPLSQWLFSALAEAELPVICVETRHMQAVLKAQINKTDRNDARGIAQMMRVGMYRPVHVKTLRSQKLRMLLTHRKLLQSKAIAIENDLRGTLRNFGLKVGMVGTVRFEARIQELVETIPDLAVLVEPLLVVRRALREQIVILHRRLLAIVRDDEVSLGATASSPMPKAPKVVSWLGIIGSRLISSTRSPLGLPAISPPARSWWTGATRSAARFAAQNSCGAW
jgi:transposase